MVWREVKKASMSGNDEGAFEQRIARDLAGSQIKYPAYVC